jgi:4,5-dihydroxyphthalate decarboxylase
MAQVALKMALSHYDRHMPFFDDTVRPEGIDLTVLEVGESIPLRHGGDRHARMLQHGEFDICEVSLSSYLMTKSRDLPFTAVPVFPRRLFSHSQMWVNVNAAIRSPKDLVGRKVGLNTFQTTLSVLAKGDLQSEYGVPWREIEWYVSREETVAFTPEKGVTIRVVPKGRKMGAMLDRGEIDAIMMPHPPEPLLRGSKNITRLFANARDEELKYFRKNGFFPIMHILAIKPEVLKKKPLGERQHHESYEEAKNVCRHYYDDPAWSWLAWGKHFVEEQQQLFGNDPWPSGIEKNRANLERFMAYSLDQGLMAKKMSVEELFDESVR